jgi:hypothetical protein
MAKQQDFEYVPLTKEQKRFCKQSLLRSNMLLKKWEGFYPENDRHVFRRQIMAGETNPSGKIPADKLSELQSDLLTIRAPRKVRHDELGQRTVEEAVLSGFVALCRKHARMWSREGDPNGITFNDYLHEAYAIILGAMYAFTRDDIDLSTFFWWVLHNRMINVTNQQRFLRLKNDDLKLVVTYEKTRSSANKAITFEEIVKLMGLDNETANRLGPLLTRIYTENQISLNGNGEDSGDDDMGGSGDYTACRAGLRHDDETRPVDAKLTVETAIENADLNDFEKVVIRAFLADDSLGWQTRLAESLVNPNTGKHYSRMWITMAKEKAMEKLRNYLTSAEAA